jgi:hypothetical protein
VGAEYDLVGTIFLRRKHFPRGSHDRTQGDHSVTRNNQLLYYGHTLPQRVKRLENESYLNAVATIIKQARASVRRRVRGAEIWPPPYDLDCLNFVKAHEQLKERKKSA